MLLQNFIVTGDTHARHEPYEDDLMVSEQLLWDLAKLAKKNMARVIILNGDVWHVKHLLEGRDPRRQEVLLMLYRVLYSLKLRGFEVIWIRGNHEIQWRTDPHNTLMKLFSKVCNVVIKPRKIQTPQYVMWLLPWYPGPIYKKLLKEVTKQALTETRKKIIISHIGVKEGTVSASNYRIDQEVGTKDFCPHLFDYIILGDYHQHQYLADNVLYLGAPIPLTFGDTGNVGPWCLRLTANPTLQPLVLPSVYPQYDKYEIPSEAHLVLHSYKSSNRNLIRCPVSLAAKVESLYPDARVDYFEDSSIESHSGRLESLEEAQRNNKFEIFKLFAAGREWGDRHVELGNQYLKDATLE